MCALSRFIKVFWHMDKSKGAVKDRLGQHTQSDNSLIQVHGERVTKTVVYDENKKSTTIEVRYS